MKLLLVIILGYLVGSIPFALVIGKVFYKTDVRQYGSGNLGGGNTGRVLGKKAGLANRSCLLYFKKTNSRQRAAMPRAIR